MRAVVQRVTSARVALAGDVVAEIGDGMLVLLGVASGDDVESARSMAHKLRRLRIFEDAEGRMNEPLGEREALCVSQFTLLADLASGNRPSFSGAAPAEQAEPLYELVRDELGAQGGVFGARMAVELVNDGPVTIVVDV